MLLANEVQTEPHVVDAASIAVNRRHRRAKTDAIDGETLLRTLMALLAVSGLFDGSAAEPEDVIAPGTRERWNAAQGTHSVQPIEL